MAIAARLAGRQTHIEHEYRMAHKSGRWVWVLTRGVVVYDDEGRPVRLAGSQTDIASRKEAEAELRRSALHDNSNSPNELASTTPRYPPAMSWLPSVAMG